MRWNAAVAGLAASWGFIAVIVAGVDLDAAVLAFWRLALAAGALAVVLAVSGSAGLAWPAGRMPAVAGAGVVLGAHWFLFFETIKLSSVAVALLTVYTAPLFLAAFAPAFLPERRSRVTLVALAPAAAGLALVALAGGDTADASAVALVTGLAAAATYAALVITVKRLAADLDVRTITAWMYGVAALAVVPLTPFADRLLPRGAEIGYVVLLGVLFTAVSGLVYVALLRRVTAQAVGLLAFLEPVSAALLAWAILDQRLSLGVALGGALVLVAGGLVVAFEPSETAVVEAPFGTDARVRA